MKRLCVMTKISQLVTVFDDYVKMKAVVASGNVDILDYRKKNGNIGICALPEKFKKNIL